MFNYSEFKCEWIHIKDLWEIADNFFLQQWPEGTLPVDMEKIIEARLRLNIEPKHNLKSQIDMDAFLRRDMTGIVVDNECYMEERFQNRTRFSFAHEVGHFVLHKEIYSQFPIYSPQDWKDFILNVPEQEYESFEWQANEFAGRLLVPRKQLIIEIYRVYGVIKDKGLLPYLKDDPQAVLSRVSPTICKPFGVSTDVIEMRVAREGLWPPVNWLSQ